MFRTLSIVYLLSTCCSTGVASRLGHERFFIVPTIQPDLVENYLSAKKYSPLPKHEITEKLLEFIGSGEQIITVALPILPTLLCARFNNVLVIDSSLSQLRFTQALHEAFLNSKIHPFVAREEQRFIDYNQENIENDQLIKAYFFHIYKPIFNQRNIVLKTTKIEAKLDTILKATPNNKSTFFISTILEENIPLLEHNIDIIHHWVHQGHEVVFSLTASPYLESIESQISSRIAEEIIKTESSETPGLFHYKLHQK